MSFYITFTPEWLIYPVLLIFSAGVISSSWVIGAVVWYWMETREWSFYIEKKTIEKK